MKPLNQPNAILCGEIPCAEIGAIEGPFELPSPDVFCKRFFTWCPSYFLLESAASMSVEDGATQTQSAGVIPVDSRFLVLCRRPRLWWLNWSIPFNEETDLFPPKKNRTKILEKYDFIIKSPRVSSGQVGSRWMRANRSLSPLRSPRAGASLASGQPV